MAASAYACSSLRSGSSRGDDRVVAQQQPPKDDKELLPPSDEVIFSTSNINDGEDDNFLPDDELDESTSSLTSPCCGLTDDTSERSVDTNGAVRGSYYSARLYNSSLSSSSLSCSGSHDASPAEDYEDNHHNLKIDHNDVEDTAERSRPKSPPPRRFRAEDLGFDTRFVCGRRTGSRSRGSRGGGVIPRRCFSHDDAYSYGDINFDRIPNVSGRSTRGQDGPRHSSSYGETHDSNRYCYNHPMTSGGSQMDHGQHQVNEDSYERFDEGDYRGERSSRVTRFPNNNTRDRHWHRIRSFEEDYHGANYHPIRSSNHPQNHIRDPYPQELRRWSMVEQSIDPLPRYHHDRTVMASSDHYDSRRDLPPWQQHKPFHQGQNLIQARRNDSSDHPVEFAALQQQQQQQQQRNPRSTMHPTTSHESYSSNDAPRPRSSPEDSPQLLSSRFLTSRAQEDFYYNANTAAIGSRPGAHHVTGPPPEYYYNRQNDGIYQDDNHELNRCYVAAARPSWTRNDDMVEPANTWQHPEPQQVLWDELEKLQAITSTGAGYCDQKMMHGDDPHDGVSATKKINHKSSQSSSSSSVSSSSSMKNASRLLSSSSKESYQKLTSSTMAGSTVLPTKILKGQYSVCPTPASKRAAEQGSSSSSSSSTTRGMAKQENQRSTKAGSTSQRAGRGGDGGGTIWVEISPGIKEPLRRTEETRRAVARDFFSPVSCRSCSHDLFCITDCKYFACPKCECISSVLDNDGGGGDGLTSDRNEGRPIQRHGLGVGFTVETLFRMQSELIESPDDSPSSSSSRASRRSEGGSTRRSLASNAA